MFKKNPAAKSGTKRTKSGEKEGEQRRCCVEICENVFPLTASRGLKLTFLLLDQPVRPYGSLIAEKYVDTTASIKS